MNRLDLIDFDDFANIYLGYHVYGIFEYPEFNRRLAAKRAENASTVSVPNLSDGSHSNNSGADLLELGLDVSGSLINTAPLPHRPDGLFNQTEEQAS